MIPAGDGLHRRVLDLVGTPIAIPAAIVPAPPGRSRSDRFEGVSFGHGATSASRILLEIPAGSTLGIVGATGSGKSTIVELLLRLYGLNSGTIRLDGQPVQALELGDLRKAIGLVNQRSSSSTDSGGKRTYGSFEASRSAIGERATGGGFPLHRGPAPGLRHGGGGAGQGYPGDNALPWQAILKPPA